MVVVVSLATICLTFHFISYTRDVHKTFISPETLLSRTVLRTTQKAALGLRFQSLRPVMTFSLRRISIISGTYCAFSSC